MGNILKLLNMIKTVLRYAVAIFVIPFWPFLVIVLIIGVYFKRPRFLSFIDECE